MSLHLYDWLWLFTALPGFALLLRARGAWLDHGAFAGLAASYVATFVLLTPVVVAGYAFGWQVSVLGYVLLGLIALAAGDLVWRWRALEQLAPPSLLGMVVFLLVFVDYGTAFNVGTHDLGDAHYHMARVRLLMETGFYDWDPYSPAHLPDVVYHSNAYHALIAAWAQFSGVEAFEAWSRMLPWSKLVVAGAAEALAFALFRSRPIALGSAAAAALAWLPLSMMPYPNQLAGLWLLPLALASGIELLCGDRPWPAAFGLAGTAVVTMQFHGLYFAFQCIALGPVLFGAVLYALARRRTRRAALVPALGLLALCAGLPWFASSAAARDRDLGTLSSIVAKAVKKAATKLTRKAKKAKQPKPAEPGVAAADEGPDYRADNWRYRGFRLLPRERLALDFGQLDATNVRLQLLAALLLAAVLSRQRRRALVLLASVATVLLVLHVPALCTVAVRAAGTPWVLRRMDVIVVFAALIALPGVFGLLLLERGWLRGVGPLLAFALLLGYAYDSGVDDGAWSRERYARDVMRPQRVEQIRRRQARRSELLRTYVPAGSVVATDLATALELPQLCHCYPLGLPAPEGLHGMEDMRKRRRAASAIFSPDVNTTTRAALLRRYGIKYLYVPGPGSTKALRKLLKPLTVTTRHTRGGMLIVVDGNRPIRNAP